MTTQNIYSMTDVWDDVGTTFKGISLSVTDTASASGSLLMDLQVGGVSQFSVTKAGIVGAKNRFSISLGRETAGVSTAIALTAGTSQQTFLIAYRDTANRTWVGFSGNWDPSTGIFGVNNFGSPLIRNATSLGWVSAASIFGSTADLELFRDAADTLAQRRSTNPQAFRVYGSYTDGSNSRRLVLNMSAGGVAEIKPEGLGTGASGNVLHISGLPTSNPGAGILWNNGGTVEVGT